MTIFNQILNAEEIIYPAKLGDKYGYINSNGVFVIKPQFDEADFFHEKKAFVKIAKNPYFINEKGKNLFMISYPWVYPVYFSNGYTKSYDNTCSYINNEGQKVFDQDFAFCGDFTNGIASVKISKDQGYGILNGKGILNSAPAVDCLWNHNEGYVAFSKDKKLGFLNLRGEIAISNIYGPIDDLSECINDEYKFSEDLAKVPFEDKFIYIDKNGKPITNNTYKYASNFENGFAIVSTEDADLNNQRQYSFINKQEKIVFSIKATSVLQFKQGLSIIEKTNETFLWINTNFDIVAKKALPKSKHNILDFFDGKISRFSSIGNKVIEYEFVNNKGTVIYAWKELVH